MPGAWESIPVKILIEPKIFTMKDKGQFNELYDYECWNCRERCVFQGEEHPAMYSLQLCRHCGEIAKINMDGPSQRSKLQDNVRELISNIHAVFLDIGEKMTARGVFYQLTTRGAAEKTEEGYGNVCRILSQMRWRGWLSWDLIVDESRFFLGTETYQNAQQALDHWAKAYRRELWQGKDVEVQIYVEKLALAGIMRTITDEYDVRLFPMRGFNSLSYIKRIATEINASGKHCFLYHFGDYDPSGVCAAETFKDTLVNMGARNFTFERVAVHPWQIQDWNLPTRPTKQSDKRAKGFQGDSCELDAIPPGTLRTLLEQVITRHIGRDEIEHIKGIEAEERKILRQLATG